MINRKGEISMKSLLGQCYKFSAAITDSPQEEGKTIFWCSIVGIIIALLFVIY